MKRNTSVLGSGFLGSDQVELHLGRVSGWGFVWFESNLEATTFTLDFGAPVGTSKLLLQEMGKKKCALVARADGCRGPVLGAVERITENAQWQPGLLLPHSHS